MKFTLLVVGKTVEKHYIAAIDDYVQRIKHYIPFDIEVIPELKNTKSLSTEQQKEKEGELILKALQPGDVPVLLDEHGKEFRSMEFATWIERKRHLDRTQDAFRQAVGVHYRRSLRILDCRLSGGTGKNITFEDDLLPPDDTPHLRGAIIPCDEHPQQ